jgi:Xaa-Pro aminopeptidase
MWDIDLIDEIWTDRPALSQEPVWQLSEQYAGVSCQDKLALVRDKLKEAEADIFVLTTLDDIAWLLNLRGNDVACNPVFLSYMIIEENRAVLYAQPEAFSEEIRNHLAGAHVELKDYQSIYGDLKFSEDKVVLLDCAKVNYMVRQSIPAKVQIIDKTSPVTLLKAVKNETECNHIREAHIKDGVAVTKFMYWLKHTIGNEAITEISAAHKLEELRKEQEDYIGPSFEPIMAYGAHGAIVHYSATEESNAVLEPKGLLLSDTGGQYMEGTTDITRTYALGELTEEEKRDYTLVLKGNLRLAAAKFMYGVCGQNLDYLAREALWEYGLDYNHGTGHGVGYLLNVHEGPNAFRWKIRSDIQDNAVLEEGMVTSDEPGVYIRDSFGIRLENLILCQQAEKTEYGQFMCFETLTMVPFDLDAIDIRYMNDKDIALLNAYHRKVYATIAPYLTPKEQIWLKEATTTLFLHS